VFLVGYGQERETSLNKRLPYILAGLCGVAGAIILGISFAINPAPPANATTAQLADYAAQHHNTIVLSGWMQGTGSLLIVLFALALVHFSGATNTYAGWVTLLSGAVILMVSLVEVALYLGAVDAVLSGDVNTGLTSNALIKEVQHLFLIAPALLLPLGFVLLQSHLLPRIFSYTAFLLGAVLQIGGLLGILHFLQPVIDIVLIVQNIWFILAGIVVMIRIPKVE
jgi:hypothetical protein